MGLRKASSYSKKKARPYTRKSTKKSKAFIKTIPQNKIVKFNMGDGDSYRKRKHKYEMRLISAERVQIRDNSLEACRQLVNKILDKAIPGNYYFVVKVFPHHILRENKAAGGQAGADRLSHGMKHSFGITIGRAAIVNKGKEIFFISCPDEKTARIARAALSKVKAKIPCRSRIIFEMVSET